MQTFDERRDILVCKTAADTVAGAAQHLLRQAKEAIAARGRFMIALSGGRTPKAIYQLLASEAYRKAIDWSSVYLFWSDERSMPKDHPESNYRMAMQAGFARLGIPSEQIFRMQGEQNIVKHALDYETTVSAHTEDGALDFVMLGIGEDGHTASLFPYTHGLNAKNRLVIANYIPRLNVWRMSLTFEAIKRARCVCLYAIGKAKGAIVAKVLCSPFDPMRLPAQKIGTQTSRALFLLDDAAVERVLCRISQQKELS